MCIFFFVTYEWEVVFNVMGCMLLLSMLNSYNFLVIIQTRKFYFIPFFNNNNNNNNKTLTQTHTIQLHSETKKRTKNIEIKNHKLANFISHRKTKEN